MPQSISVIIELKAHIVSYGVINMRLFRKSKKIIFLMGLIAVIMLLVIVYIIRIRPMIIELAIAETSDAVTLTVNKTIADKLAEGSIHYSDLVTFEKDSNGKITALMTDMAKTNALQAEMTNQIILDLSDKSEVEISIPIGNFFGSTLLSGKGPNVNVNIISVTNVDAVFENKFSSAGINQTRHQIFLNIIVELTILVPGCSADVTVPVEMCVAETIIVGDVPGSYAYIE